MSILKKITKCDICGEYGCDLDGRLKIKQRRDLWWESWMTILIGKINAVDDKIDNLKFVSPYRVEREKTETIYAKFSLPNGVNMLEKDVKARLAEELIDGVLKYMITYSHYNPKNMENEFMGYVKVVVCPEVEYGRSI